MLTQFKLRRTDGPSHFVGHNAVQGGDHDSKANAEVFVQFAVINRSALRYRRPPYVVHFTYSCLADNAPEYKLDVSFSRVKYMDIAPLVGLEPIIEGFDIEMFAMSRARLPDTVFQKILAELHVFALQRNEEARSRFLSAIRYN